MRRYSLLARFHSYELVSTAHRKKYLPLKNVNEKKEKIASSVAVVSLSILIPKKKPTKNASF